MKNRRVLTCRWLLLCAVSWFVFGCDSIILGEEDALISLEENLHTPPLLADGWQVASMESEGINSLLIDRLVSNFQNNPRKIHSLLIVKNNKLVVEAYFGGWHRTRLQSLRSASKSVTSALIGIAIDKKYIHDVNQRLFDFFPAYADLKTDKKDNILLHHVLTMNSGLQWDQTSYPEDEERNDELALKRSEDGFRYILQKPVVASPGLSFNYSSGNSELLTGIIHATTGVHADVFAGQHLFTPLGITHYGWRKHNNLFPNAGYGLHLYPRDMAKIGQLFLDKGQWKGRQVISQQWIEASTKKYSEPALNQGYGYQWWVRSWQVEGSTIDTFQAQGNGGQIICVIPDLQTVVILTGNNEGYSAGQLPYSLLQNYILPALL